ncbi:MAG: hypothetical protein A7315_13380 [Candidatus Altiarchaeales archaeon WOR_SM1_79]|nr:MAG: hypothetical protein A7315_13380 [Candidatus Altiarchaeales archaeon WOR_SM1_79]
MQTSIPNIYACGDCIEIEDILTGKKVQSGYGTQADREGHIAGINIAGGVVGTFEGTLGSVVTKAMDLEIGRTGLMETEAKEAGYETVSGIVKTKTKPDYYPGAKDFWTHLIFDAKSEKLLGAQIAGGEDVVGYVNLASMALQKGNTLHDTLKFKLRLNSNILMHRRFVPHRALLSLPRRMLTRNLRGSGKTRRGRQNEKQNHCKIKIMDRYQEFVRETGARNHKFGL